MNRPSFCLTLLLLTSLIHPLQAQYTIKDPAAIPLHGTWQFSLDPMATGQTNRWYREDAPLNRWDPVTVPHCFSVDPRYQFYTGTVWYRRTFPWQPEPGKRVILHFDAAYYQTTVWLNNQQVGTHEGGYTPFSFDITPYLKSGTGGLADNTLAVSVDNNTLKVGTIPGAKDNGEPGGHAPGWVNYGGLIRPVYLTVEPTVYIENIKTDATPDLAAGTARLNVRVRMRNAGNQAVTPKLTCQVMYRNKPVALNWKQTPGRIGANETVEQEAEAVVKAADVNLWHIDRPNLYTLRVIADQDTLQTHFGIRQVTVTNAQLLLNGKPIKLAGGNRVIDYPGLGSLEPDWLVEKDLRLMKEAGMEFQRLTHYTPSETVYDWADRHGMLIISEAGNWQLTPSEMDNDTIRANFRRQFREMAERDWNHPCVVAYSVGNEYLSETPSGQRWTKDMIAYARQLDPTRLYTFASMQLNKLASRQGTVGPGDEASQYVDFVSTNTYGNHLNTLKFIHSLYPGKPIFVSEYGLRSDTREGEAGQVAHLEKFLTDIRSLPYVVGASWWSFNDYLSRHSGTSPDGTRPWGLVRHDRSKRPLYNAYRTAMAPVTVEKTGWMVGREGVHTLTLRVTARTDFPAYALKQYRLKTPQTTVLIPDLQPGQHADITVPVRGFDNRFPIDILKPTGFSILTQLIDSTNDTRTGN